MKRPNLSYSSKTSIVIRVLAKKEVPSLEVDGGGDVDDSLECG